MDSPHRAVKDRTNVRKHASATNVRRPMPSYSTKVRGIYSANSIVIETDGAKRLQQELVESRAEEPRDVPCWSDR